jgi:hypothetical protein
MLDLILTSRPHRRAPVPLVLLAHTARLALEKGFTSCVFEADERYDHFAVGFACRCGAKAQWRRFRYAISRSEMQLRAVPGTTR